MTLSREHIPHPRRSAIVIALTAFTTPPVAQLQPAARKVRIAYLGGSTPDPVSLRNLVEPLRQGLRELGHVEGHNLTIDFRWAEGKYERLPGLLDELVRLEPDVLVTAGPRPAMLVKDAVKKLPVVVAVDDPVQMGLIASYTRPGGSLPAAQRPQPDLRNRSHRRYETLTKARTRCPSSCSASTSRSPTGESNTASSCSTRSGSAS